LLETTDALAYLAILIGTIIEGEVVLITAAVLVSQGQINPVGVAIAGAAGATLGDQAYFYALRGRLRRWLDRYPAIRARGVALTRRVRQHESLTVLSIRFSPGLRIALAAACAFAEVPRLKFSVLSAISATIWASGLVLLVAVAGPRWLPGLGVS